MDLVGIVNLFSIYSNFFVQQKTKILFLFLIDIYRRTVS
jgi:hypothetical protein